MEEKMAPIPIQIALPEGFWQRQDVNFPDPVSPMQDSLFTRFWNPMMERVFEDVGLPFGGMDMKIIGGYVYEWIKPSIGGGSPPSLSSSILARVVEAVRTDRRGRYIEAWYDKWHPRFKSRTCELLKVDLNGIGDDMLDAQISAAVSLFEDAAKTHFILVFSIPLPLWRFFSFCRASFGWEDPKVFEMLGESELTVEPSRKLVELAKMASAAPSVMRLLNAKSDKVTIEDVREASSSFAAALSTYLREYGHRVLRYDVSLPTMAEDPALILKLIRDQIRSDRSSDPLSAKVAEERRQSTISEARRLAEKKSKVEGKRFEQLLRDAERAYPTLEDSQFYLSQSVGLIRERLLELGRRLVKRNILVKPEDIFFLRIEEAWNELRSRGGTDLLKLIERRKGERVWAEAHPGPSSYGKPPGPPPSMEHAPPEAREVMESMIWHVENLMSGRSSQANADTLSGKPGSAGKYTGAVRVIANESEFWKLKNRDVLVCRVTTPTWTVLFPSIGALVTDKGGLLSHPAICAREYHIPAVVGTEYGTKVLHDGDVVIVDGDKGIVKKEMHS